MTSTRRSLLRAGVAGSILLAAGGVGLGLYPSVERAAPQGLKVLDARSWSVLAAIADRLCPGGDGLPSARDLGVATLLDQTLHTLHPLDAAELHQLLLLVENALVGMVFDGRPRPFTACSPPQQDRALAAWRDSRLQLRRSGFKALRGLIMAAYWGHPDTFAGSGYPGPPDFGQAAAPLPDWAVAAHLPAGNRTP